MNVRLTLLAVMLMSSLLPAQQKQPQPNQTPAAPDSGLLIQTETKLVLVDTVVTDKKGAYVADLKLKDFKVSEDGKDQTIKTFSYEADPASGAQERTHYLVLVFDNSTMNPADQIRARQAAAKFIDTNTGPNRMMAIVNFGGTMQVAQNFTSNRDRLKATVNGVKYSSVSPNDSDVAAAPISSGGLTTVAMDFAARDMLQTLRSLAKGLGPTPGRKILVLFTAGFRLTTEQQSEVTATIDECNKSNVAIYPVDVRGLTTIGTGMPPIALLRTFPRPPSFDSPVSPSFASPELASPEFAFKTIGFVPTLPFLRQARGGGPVGGGASPGGASAGGGVSGGGRGASAPSGGTVSTPSPSAPSSSPGGARTPSGPTNGPTNGPGTPGVPGRGPGTPNGNNNGVNNNGMPGANAPCMGGPGMGGPGIGPAAAGIPGVPSPCQSRTIIPKIPDSATTNQQVMFMLASGTGGFVIHDSNDLLAGLEKIGKEQNQYYILGYTPPESKGGNCHVLHVKVDRGGTEVRARTGYCTAKPADALAGNPVEKTLEAKLAAAPAGKVAASMSLPFFYSSPNVARVNVAMEISAAALKFEKSKANTMHSEVNFLGVAYTQQGAVAARFSDTLKVDFNDKQEAEEAKQKPLHYENQFDIAPGTYNFKIIYSEGGDNFGKMEMPLQVDPYKADALAISGLALSKQYHRTQDLGGTLDVALLEDKTPLIADGLLVVPTGNTSFAKSELAIFYFEMYEPLLVSADPKSPPIMGIRMRVLDRKTGEQKSDTGVLRLDPQPPAGNPVVRLGEKMPVSGLPPGSYKLEVTAVDSADQNALRTADFDIQ